MPVVDVGGSTANITLSISILRTAALGSPLPTLTSNPLVWDTAWIKHGYTDKGASFKYQVKTKPINVEESAVPVKIVLDAIDGEITADLAEFTAANLGIAIPGATVTAGSPNTVEVGTGTLSETMVSLEGADDDGNPIVIIGYRAMAAANINAAFRRTEKLMIPVAFTLLNDSTKTPGKDVAIVALYH